MRLPDRIYGAISLTMLFISLSAWLLLLVNPGHVLGIVHCHVSDAGLSKASLNMLLFMNPISSLLSGWCLMVVGMMLPKLILPVTFIYGKALKRRRLPMALIFIFGYISIWALIGILMIAIMLTSTLLFHGSFIPAFIVATIALVWQFSPIKQYCLNKGHEHSVLPAFGWASFRDAFLFGLRHGVWCVGSGWALMLFPMLLTEGHNFAMVIITFLMFSEHIEHPQVPRWRLRFHSKLIRMIFVQTRMMFGADVTH